MIRTISRTVAIERWAVQAAREVNSAGRLEAELVRVTDSKEAERLLRSQVLTDCGQAIR